MRKELPHFNIGNSYGGNQEWFRTFMMRLGGCGAETACDSSIYMARELGLSGLYPFDERNLTRTDYVNFGHIMEKYLWPRMSGINTLDIYIEGYTKYMQDAGVTGLSLAGFSGNQPYSEASRVLRKQIDAGYPVPTLMLRHSKRRYRDYVWHWFILNGYDTGLDGDDGTSRDVTGAAAPGAAAGVQGAEYAGGTGSTGTSSPDDGAGRMLVKAVTYSEYEWLSFPELWDTGYEERGGLILFSQDNK